MHGACSADTEHVADTEHALHALSMPCRCWARVACTEHALQAPSTRSRPLTHQALHDVHQQALQTPRQTPSVVPVLSPRVRQGSALPSVPLARCGSAHMAGLSAGKPQPWDGIFTLPCLWQRQRLQGWQHLTGPHLRPRRCSRTLQSSHRPKGFGCPASGEPQTWLMSSGVGGRAWEWGREPQGGRNSR